MTTPCPIPSAAFPPPSPLLPAPPPPRARRCPDLATQPGLFALLPQVVDAVAVPVIAAGGVADPRGVAAALALGACGVQVGTAYLFTPEAQIPPAHRAALESARDDNTMLTDVFTGRPARAVVNRPDAGPGTAGLATAAFSDGGSGARALEARGPEPRLC